MLGNIGGIIPAYAGSTAKRGALSCRCRDHPRIRGEHSRVPRVRVLMSGSSPHTRGARLRPLGARSPGRIIPAYAGSTRHPDRGLRRSADHPRIRGEHFPGRVTFQVEGGSSPHTRGARLRTPPRPRPWRIIPAYAGSTRTCPPAGRPGSDHPRIRGEHVDLPTPTNKQAGSSPHTRGAPPPQHTRGLPRRIIPAYAGSTWVCT
mgnify:CR=1 FL=1